MFLLIIIKLNIIGASTVKLSTGNNIHVQNF